MEKSLIKKLKSLSLVDTAALLAQKEVSSEEITKAMIDTIKSSTNNAYITVNPLALDEAKKADQRRQGGKTLSPLDGLPLALKDNICTEGLKTTCASKMLADFVPPYTAAVAEKLAQAGTVLMGKTNMDEFACGNGSDTSYFGPVTNPLAADKVAGGSSGGSAAAVAEGSALAAIGTDTGGSIRQPAAFCGLVGLKPSYGRVSRFGIAGVASSLDQPGSLTKTVADAALLLALTAGKDPRDACTFRAVVPDYTLSLKGSGGLKGLRLGVPKEYLDSPSVQPAIRDNLKALIKELTDAGAMVEECSLPKLDYALATYCVIATAECSSNMGRFDGVKYGYRAPVYEGYDDMVRQSRSEAFGAEVKRRILWGAYTLSAGHYEDYFLRAQKARTLIKEDFQKAYEKYDLLLAPTTTRNPWLLGTEFEDPCMAYALDFCTVAANLAGLAAISLPYGSLEGLPLGVQLMGPVLKEELVLQGAHGIEELALNSGKHPLALARSLQEKGGPAHV